MKFDHEILFELLPEEDKKSFMVWDRVILTQKYNSIPGSVQNVVATYRTRLFFDAAYNEDQEERLLIPLDEYEIKLKQKERDIKLGKLI